MWIKTNKIWKHRDTDLCKRAKWGSAGKLQEKHLALFLMIAGDAFIYVCLIFYISFLFVFISMLVNFIITEIVIKKDDFLGFIGESGNSGNLATELQLNLKSMDPCPFVSYQDYYYSIFCLFPTRYSSLAAHVLEPD